MIASLRGRLRRRLEDRVVVESSGVGYEVFLPPVVWRALADIPAGNGADSGEVSLVIYYHVSQAQPKPLLIGFRQEIEREFFEKLITVQDVGPLVAARALVHPIGEIADAIARGDEAALRRLPGIGLQKSRNIVAALQEKVAKFALMPKVTEAPPPPAAHEDLREMVREVLVKQLGHRPGEAERMITEAFARKPKIETPEELFDEIYRGEKKT